MSALSSGQENPLWSPHTGSGDPMEWIIDRLKKKKKVGMQRQMQWLGVSLCSSSLIQTEQSGNGIYKGQKHSHRLTMGVCCYWTGEISLSEQLMTVFERLMWEINHRVKHKRSNLPELSPELYLKSFIIIALWTPPQSRSLIKDSEIQENRNYMIIYCTDKERKNIWCFLSICPFSIKPAKIHESKRHESKM